MNKANNVNSNNNKSISITERIKRKFQKLPIPQINIAASNEMASINNKIITDSELNQALIELENNPQLLLTSYSHQDLFIIISQ